MELQIFKNDEFGEIRTLEINNEPWFVGKDIAGVLGYVDANRAVKQHVDKEDLKVCNYKGYGDLIPTLWNNENDFANKVLINESGLYTLVFNSELPNAKKFKRWVTAEVLPTIRKHGMYATDELLNNPDLAIKTFEALKAERERNKQLTADNEVMKPKALFADAVSASDTSISIGDLAKLICQNGVKIGRNRLFNWLKNNGYLIKDGHSKNIPKQRYVERGLFEVKESIVQNPDGTPRVAKTTKVTGKGQLYFINKFLKGEKNEK